VAGVGVVAAVRVVAPVRVVARMRPVPGVLTELRMLGIPRLRRRRRMRRVVVPVPRVVVVVVLRAAMVRVLGHSQCAPSAEWVIAADIGSSTP
jgi:hypothetical protein